MPKTPPQDLHEANNLADHLSGGAPESGAAHVSADSVHDDFDSFLASFGANVLQLELWLSAMEDAIAAPSPDLKRIRIHNLDIPAVLAEAGRQVPHSNDDALKERFFSLIPRLQDYVWRSDDVLKGFAPRPIGAPPGPRSSTEPPPSQPPALPPMPPVDNNRGGEDDGRMNERITALEKFAEKSAERLGRIEQDVAVIRANSATKDDLAKVAQDVAVIRSNYATKEDLHKELHGMTLKVIGSLAAFTAVVFFAARYVAPPAAPAAAQQPAQAVATPAVIPQPAAPSK